MKRLFIAAVAFSATTFTYAQTAIKSSETPATPNPVETPAPVTSETAAPAPAAEIEEAAAIDTAAPAIENADDRKPVKISDLPAAVQKELGTKQYEGWAPTTAYWVTGDKPAHYEITFAKGDESKTVKYNAEGSKLD